MQITLNVQGSQLDNEVKELLANLTVEQKQELAMQVLKDTLANTQSKMQRQLVTQVALEEFNQTHKTDYRLSQSNELVGSNGYSVGYEDRNKFNAVLSKHNDVLVFFKDVILKEMADKAKAEVKTLVQESLVITAAIEAAKTEITTHLPKLVQDAMIVYFASQMETMMQGIAQAKFQSQAAGKLTQEIQQSLSSKGIY